MPDLQGPLDPHALAQGKSLLVSLPSLANGEHIDREFDHWSVEEYGSCDGQYNIVIELENGQWVAKISTSPRLNAVQVSSLHPYAAHTYQRNSHAVGIAVNGMIGATTSDFGSQPIQLHEIEVLCAANAAVAKKYGIDLGGSVNGEHTLMTHAEAAILDSYFPGDGDPQARWDLARLHASNAPLTKDEARATGDLIRARSHAYKLEL